MRKQGRKHFIKGKRLRNSLDERKMADYDP